VIFILKKAPSAAPNFSRILYETSKGEVEIAFMNLGMMSGMFTGVPHEVLKSSAQNLENAIKDFIQ